MQMEKHNAAELKEMAWLYVDYNVYPATEELGCIIDAVADLIHGA